MTKTTECIDLIVKYEMNWQLMYFAPIQCPNTVLRLWRSWLYVKVNDKIQQQRSTSDGGLCRNCTSDIWLIKFPCCTVWLVFVLNGWRALLLIFMVFCHCI